MMRECKDRPTLKGYLNHNGVNEKGEEVYTLHVYCPYCRKFHTHGITQHEFHEKKNHRVAHCDDSPLVETDYYIAPWTAAELKEILTDCRLNKKGE